MDGQILSLSTIAATNIAEAINAQPEKIPAIEQALKDEVDALGAHFTMMFSDLVHNFETEKEQIKSAFCFAEENIGKLVIVATVVYALGVITGLVL